MNDTILRHLKKIFETISQMNLEVDQMQSFSNHFSSIWMMETSQNMNF